jgi:hypothetical protein
MIPKIYLSTALKLLAAFCLVLTSCGKEVELSNDQPFPLDKLPIGIADKMIAFNQKHGTDFQFRDYKERKYVLKYVVEKGPEKFPGQVEMKLLIKNEYSNLSNLVKTEVFAGRDPMQLNCVAFFYIIVYSNYNVNIAFPFF